MCSRVAPHAPVDPECDERDVSHAENNRQGAEEDRSLQCTAFSANDDEVGEQERGADQNEVDKHLDEPPGVECQRMAERRVAHLAAACALVEVAEEAAELDEQYEREQHADGGHPSVVEDVVRHACATERKRDDRE